MSRQCSIAFTCSCPVSLTKPWTSCFLEHLTLSIIERMAVFSLVATVAQVNLYQDFTYKDVHHKSCRLGSFVTPKSLAGKGEE